MDQVAGVGALALAVLWGAYYVPQRLRQRNQLVEARVDDRFSGAMRVLAVSSKRAATEPDSERECGAGAEKRTRLLTPPMGVVMAGPPRQELEGAGTMSENMAGSREANAGKAEAGRRVVVPSTQGAVRRPAPVRPSRHAHAVPAGPASGRGPGHGVYAARAAAARRRLILTLALLAASVGSWIATATAGFKIAVPIVSTLLLGTVLVLGRRAVVSAQRADAARMARMRGEAPIVRVRSGRPTAVIVGRAVRGSQANTEMISSAQVAQRVTGAAPSIVVPGNASETETGATEVEETGGAENVGETDDVVGGSDKSERTPELEDETDGGAELARYAVPRPTYVSKAAAPRREPAPLKPEDVTTPATASARASAKSAASGGSAVSPLTAEELEDMTPSPDGLGVDLNRILARRRAAGA